MSNYQNLELPLSKQTMSVSIGSSPPPDRPKNEWSNQIFYSEQGNTLTYYIPAYLVILLKKLDKFNFAEGSVSASTTLVLRLMTKNLPPLVKDKLHTINMRLNETDILTFDENSSDIKETSGLIVFTMRTKNDVIFKTHLENFPFDIQTLVLKCELTSKTFKLDDDKTAYQFRFNFHINNEFDVMLRFKRSKNACGKNGEIVGEDEIDNMPELNIAYGLVETPTTQPEEKSGIAYLPSVTAKIPLFREPEYVLLSSCIPLLLLNIISVCIFSLDPLDYSNRLSMIITILLALFAFLPTYRQQIPIPTITALDVAVFGSVFIMLLVVVDSVIGTYNVDDHNVLWGFSVGLVVIMSCYMVVKYVMYVKHKKMMERFKGGGKVSSGAEFEFPLWEAIGMKLPAGAQRLE